MRGENNILHLFEEAPAAPKSNAEVRAACLQSFYRRIGVLEEILDGDKTSPAEKIRAMDLLAKVGVSTQRDSSEGDTTAQLTPEQRRARIAELLEAARARTAASESGDGVCGAADV